MGGEKWDQKALLSRAAAGDEDAVNELVQKNLGLVHSVVKKFSNSPYEAEDPIPNRLYGAFKSNS